MAHKESLKKAVQIDGGGYRWKWNGQNGIHHVVEWHKNGQTFWMVYDGETLLRTEEPWFLVTARGEVQENIKYFRNAGLDLRLANTAQLAAGLLPDQHIDADWCSCGNCNEY